MSISKLENSMAKLQADLSTASELGRSLRKSHTLAKLWPEAFKFGRAKTVWVSPSGQSDREGYYRKDGQHHKYHIFRVTNGAGKIREYTWLEVPILLGGGNEII